MIKDLLRHPSELGYDGWEKAPVDKQLADRVVVVGTCDHSASADVLSFGRMTFTPYPEDPELLYFTNGSSYHVYARPHPSSKQALVGRRLSQRIGNRPNIHSIFVTRKQK